MTTFVDALAHARRPRMPPGVSHLVFHSPTVYPAKPFGFPSARALASHLHRLRGDDSLELEEAPLLVQGEDAERFGVSVWTRTPEGERARYLGWCYLGGAGRNALQTALLALQPLAQLAEVA